MSAPVNESRYPDAAMPDAPEPLNTDGHWVFRGFDQMGLDVWSWTEESSEAQR